MTMNYLLITHDRLHAHPAASLRMPDELLDFYGDLYLANAWLGAIGISFELFLGAPAQWLACAQSHSLVPLDERQNFYPLLPRQRAVRDRVDAAEAGQQSFDFDRSAA